MAKFNEDLLTEKAINDEQHKMQCAMMLMGFLSNETYAKLKEDWNNIGGVKTIPWWKFIFENVEVKYEGKNK